MKKTLIFILFTLAICQVNAQLSKGNILVGGSVNFSSSNSDSDNSSGFVSSKSSQFAFSPKAGFFVSDKSVVGITLTYDTYGYKYQYPTYYDQYRQKGVAIGSFYRQYFPLGEHAAFFVQGLAQFSTGKRTNYNGYNDLENIQDTKGISFVITPGVNYFLNNKWGLEATMGSASYSMTELDGEDAAINSNSKSNHIGFNLSLSLFSLGLQYFINR
jgi:hypothetical protein